MSTYRLFEVESKFSDNVVEASPEFSTNEIQVDAEMTTPVEHQTSGGTRDYNQLSNQPSIEEVTLRGNKTFQDLGLRPARKLEIQTILQS